VRSGLPSLDKSAAIPTERSFLAIDGGYLHQCRIPITKQPNIARVNRKHPMVLSPARDIDLVETSCRTAVDRLVAATKIIKMKGYKLSAGNVEIQCKLLRDCNRSTTGCLPFLDDGAESTRQILEMGGIPTILSSPTIGECCLKHAPQTEKRDSDRRNESP
jgi:hypothetical protein